MDFEVSRSQAFFFVIFVLFICSARSETGSCAKKNENSRKCGGRCYILSKELARVAKLPMGSTVCRVHWDELRRSNIRCSVPRSTHSRNLRRQSIPARLFPVLDAFGDKVENYKPGTMWCVECAIQVDRETQFTSRPEYIPPPRRPTAQQNVSKVSYKSNRTGVFNPQSSYKRDAVYSPFTDYINFGLQFLMRYLYQKRNFTHSVSWKI